MVKSTVKKVMRVGRATVLMVSLSMMLAVVFGVASTALAHSGVDSKLFHLGHPNTATAISKLTASIAGPTLQLVNQSTDAAATALNLSVASGKPPLKVNASAGTATNLSADKLDGQDSTAYQKRVSGECAVGSSIRSIDANGVATCETDDDSGAAEVGAFREELAATDKQPNDEGDLVSYTKLRDVPTEVVNRDADTLDGKDSAGFAPSNEVHLPQRVTLTPAGTDPQTTPPVSTTLFDTGTFRVIASCQMHATGAWANAIKVQTTQALAFFSNSSIPTSGEFGSSKPAGSTIQVAESRAGGGMQNGSFAVVAAGNGEALHVQYTLGGVTSTEVCAFTASGLG